MTAAPTKPRRKLTAEDEHMIADLCAAGWPQRKVAAKFGLSQPGILKAIRRVRGPKPAAR